VSNEDIQEDKENGESVSNNETENFIKPVTEVK